MITKTTEKLVMDFVTENGKAYAISVTDPDREKTEEELKAAAQTIMETDVVKPDGTSLAVIKGIAFVTEEESTVEWN